MGVVPDLGAIRSVHKKKKKSPALQKDTNKYGPPSEGATQGGLQEKNTRGVLQRLVREDLQSLVADIRAEDAEEDAAAVADTAPALIAEWKRQKFKQTLEERAGQVLPEALASLASGVVQEDVSPLVLEAVDSDGDIDVSAVVSTSFAVSRTPQTDLEEAKKPDVVYRDVDGKRITRERWLEIQASRKGGYRPVKAQERSSKSHSLQPSGCRKDRVWLVVVLGPSTLSFLTQPAVEWGVGLVQKATKEQRFAEERELEAQPLTRYTIDTAYDEELKNKTRWEDPFRDNHDSGASVAVTAGASALPSVKRPKSRFPPPSSRFNICPGYRWDGVIRGNGFEQRLLKERNKHRHQDEEAYKWSVEEM